MSDERELEIFTADWLSLRPHYTRDALFLVDDRLELEDVCKAVAGDDKARIEKWLSENLLRKPTETDDQLWSKTPAVEFKFGIVQPFVLIQALPSTTH